MRARVAGRLALHVIVAACIGSSFACWAEDRAPCTIAFELEPDPVPLYDEPTPCDPLIMPPVQPHIMPPVAVGRTGSGAIYVVDRLDSGMNRLGVFHRLPSRFFVADGRTLVRQDGYGGLGQSTDDWHYGRFGTVDGSVHGMLRVRRTPGVPANLTPADVSMAVFDGPAASHRLPSQRFDEGTPIEVLPECAVTGYAVVDPLRERRSKYAAEDAHGNEILVTSPVFDWSTERFKLFYGPRDHVLERAVATVGRAKDGGTTHIKFDLDGEAATLRFDAVCGCGPRTSACPGALEIDGRPPVAVMSPSRDHARLRGNTYVCHDQSLTYEEWAAR